MALDIIVNGNPLTPPKYFAGGSCGNVLTILAFLGWHSYPIARLANDDASKEVVMDLKKWKVNTNLISRQVDGSTPIIIHRILKDKEGKPKHRFEFRDPDTGGWLPGYKPVLSSKVEEIIKKQPTPSVFYFDRANRASIDLAKLNKDKGALIVFEPSSNSDLRLFSEALKTCHIFKFSHERIKNYSEQFPKQQVLLEIETLGKDGLKFRFGKTMTSTVWKRLSSYQVKESELTDSAGAGDWCSAGIISALGKSGSKSLLSAKLCDIEKALKFGQALGALNCCFDGARGLMYNLTKDEVINRAAQLQEGKIKDPICKKLLVAPSKVIGEKKIKPISSLYS